MAFTCLAARPIVCISDRRSPFWPDTPAITELMDIPAELQGAWSIYNDWTGRYILFTRADVPEDRLQFIENKFQEINALKGFMRQAKLKWLPGQLDAPLTSEEINEVMKRAWSVSKDASAKSLFFSCSGILSKSLCRHARVHARNLKQKFV